MEQGNGLTKYLTPLNVWALSFGCALGWGAFVMPGSTLLPMAGPVGTILALAIGGLCMVVIATTFNYMAKRFPDSGGAFSYTKHVFGYDHAFLCSWSLVLAYIAIMWANATAIVLISRFLLGPIFQVGFHYVVAGYDVYAGEIAITLAALWIFGLLCRRAKRIVTTLNTILALAFVLGVVICFVLVTTNSHVHPSSFDPPFMPDGVPFFQILSIASLAPWAFIGFESISNAVGEINFPIKRLLPVFAIALLCGTMVYIFMTAVSVMGTPLAFANWLEYISDLGSLDGLTGLPTFNAIQAAAGDVGLRLLGFTVVCAIVTSLLGLYRATSRLLYFMAQDDILPSWFGVTNEDGVPSNAVLFIMIISVVVPFVGRAAIGWIVDVTSICATIAYGYVSACCFNLAKRDGNRPMQGAAIVGLVASIVFFIFPLIPNLWSVSTLATESYLILAVWSILGLVIFRLIFQRDTKNRFGKSSIVWIAMIFLILFSSTMWVRQATHEATNEVVGDIAAYYLGEFSEHNVTVSKSEQDDEKAVLKKESKEVQDSILANSLIQIVLILLSLGLMFSIYSLMRKREREHDLQRAAAEESSRAKTLFLSNMSHDIRTPMNAIIGYTTLAQQEDVTLDEMRMYLDKIDSSSKHLLALINDVLEMSRIESGRMDLDLTETNLSETMAEVRDMFATQMHEKNLDYAVKSSIVDPYVLCDKNRLNRVTLNLLSNAYKFTPEGGSIVVSLTQQADENAPDGCATYELSVKDSGIGMSPEFAEHVFEAFERERTSTVSNIQGTGLGMAITKSIVDLMGGSIAVTTAPNEGSEFVVRLTFPVVEGHKEEAASIQDKESAEEMDFSTKRLLVVEDNDLNLEIAVLILDELGFQMETAVNGQIALDMYKESEPGYYDLVLTDIQMPVLDGFGLTAGIRSLEDPALASIPIVACSANAFAEDIQAARDAGMDGYVAKPLDVGQLMDILTRLLR